MGYSFRGKVALVTGGSNGIGLEYVRELLRKKVKGVAIVDINPPTENDIKDLLGKEVFYFETDVTDSTQLENAFKSSIETFEQLDIVINNAGIIDEVDWEKMISLNVNAAIRCTYLAFQFMGKNHGKKGGVLVTTGSTAGLTAYSPIPVYSSTKCFLINLNKAFGTSFYFQQTGVRVLTLCPGLTATNLVPNIKTSLEFADTKGQIDRELDDLHHQSAESVGKAVSSVIMNGDNGSVWIIENDEPVYDVDKV